MEDQHRPTNRLYGITHEADGTPRIIVPKAIKVGIGLPKGKALHVYKDLTEKWVLQIGVGRETERKRFGTMEEAQAEYRNLAKDAPKRPYPERLKYFTFTRLGQSGEFEPDWEIIEQHDPIPTEIDIVLTMNEPLMTNYELYTFEGRKCFGDGARALREISMAKSPEEKKLAEKYRALGERYFPVPTGCWLAGKCPYVPTGDPDNRPQLACKPIGRLLFQLERCPRLGGTAVFTTTSRRSISQIWSGLEDFRRAVGRGNRAEGFIAGSSMKMVLRPYTTSHAGKTVVQQGVALEKRATSALALKKELIDQAVRYRIAGGESLKELEASGAPLTIEPIHPDREPAAVLAAEFPSAESVPDEADLDHDDTADEVDDQAAALTDADIPGGPPPFESENLPIGKPDPETAHAHGPVWDATLAWYRACRAKGLNDTQIYDRIGIEGFEELSDVTAEALPGLQEWIDDYVAGSGAVQPKPSDSNLPF